MSYIDFMLQEDDYGKITELDSHKALLNGVRNIVLSKPGNYPFTPKLGINVEKYIGEISDDITLDNVSSEIKNQIKKYIPNTSRIKVETMYIDNGQASSKSLGIKISLLYEGDDINTGIIVSNENDILKFNVDDFNVN